MSKLRWSRRGVYWDCADSYSGYMETIYPRIESRIVVSDELTTVKYGWNVEGQYVDDWPFDTFEEAENAIIEYINKYSLRGDTENVKKFLAEDTAEDIKRRVAILTKDIKQNLGSVQIDTPWCILDIAKSATRVGDYRAGRQYYMLSVIELSNNAARDLAPLPVVLEDYEKLLDKALEIITTYKDRFLGTPENKNPRYTLAYTTVKESGYIEIPGVPYDVNYDLAHFIDHSTGKEWFSYALGDDEDVEVAVSYKTREAAIAALKNSVNDTYVKKGE